MLRFWSYSVDGTPCGDPHPKGEMASFIWAHGMADWFAGTDLLHTDRRADILKLTTGKYKVVVLNPDHSESRAATLYFSKGKRDHFGSGLVVLDEDKEGTEDALRTLERETLYGSSMGFIAQ